MMKDAQAAFTMGDWTCFSSLTDYCIIALPRTHQTSNLRLQSPLRG